MLTPKQQRLAAKAFVQHWQDKQGYEKGETQQFWNMLLRSVFGVQNTESLIEYEKTVQSKSRNFIDAYIDSTKVLIEQKSADKSLAQAAKQSDGTFLTPYEQAKRYADELPLSQKPRWIIACNFKEFHIHDMEKPHEPPQIILLNDLPKEYHRLSFIADLHAIHIQKEVALSLEAGKIVGIIYNALSKQYKDLNNPQSLISLNKLCVRLVFCLYAEDADIFHAKDAFRDYLKNYTAREMRQALIDLFITLNTPENQRKNLYYSDDCLKFPYTNGGLFTGEIEIPQISEEIRTILTTTASDFDWSEISPTIFGAVFESTLNPETRRSGGMHYTSLENIHKVIDPLFLDELKQELAQISQLKQKSTIMKRVAEFQDKLSSLTFLDPAAGSGNFLTETYISLRRLENQALKFAYGNTQMHLIDPIKVKIGQFYGIEINDFAVSVAQTALWIAEIQMKRQTEEIFTDSQIDYLPLKSFAHFVENNALRMDWNSVISADKLNYIMGNPPFVGARIMNAEQKADIFNVFDGVKNNGNLDYVACWYKKAAEYMQNNRYIKTALVSTNSITQGEQVAVLWKTLFDLGVEIDFAYRTFRWDSESTDKAKVHCVIIGFSLRRVGFQPTNNAALTVIASEQSERGNLLTMENEPNTYSDKEIATTTTQSRNDSNNFSGNLNNTTVILNDSEESLSNNKDFSPTAQNDAISGNLKPKIIYNGNQQIIAKNINGYLLDAPSVLIEARSKPLCNVQKMVFGSMPNDGGHLIIEEEDYVSIIQKYPEIQPYIKLFLGAKEYINHKNRYCLWLKGVEPSVLRHAFIRQRIEKVKENRLASKRPATNELAEIPHLFGFIGQPESDYLLFPRVSSEKRKYIPIGFVQPEIIASDACLIIPNATLYMFGILTSSLHMAWMRAVAGRLEMRYRYSGNIVYNNFIWCEPTATQKQKIEHTAQAILDARAKYPDSSLADLYDELTMPAELRKAHSANDNAVLSAYGLPKNISEEEIVAFLMQEYQKRTTA